MKKVDRYIYLKGNEVNITTLQIGLYERKILKTCEVSERLSDVSNQWKQSKRRKDSLNGPLRYIIENLHLIAFNLHWFWWLSNFDDYLLKILLNMRRISLASSVGWNFCNSEYQSIYLNINCFILSANYLTNQPDIILLKLPIDNCQSHASLNMEVVTKIRFAQVHGYPTFHLMFADTQESYFCIFNPFSK